MNRTADNQSNGGTARIRAHLESLYGAHAASGVTAQVLQLLDEFRPRLPQLVARIGQSFDLMFDAVFNHMSAQGEWFLKFPADTSVYRNFFVTDEGSPDFSQAVRTRALPLLAAFQSATGLRKVWTTFNADQVNLNFKNPEGLLATLRALLCYVEEGARFIRLDAIAYLCKSIGTSCIHLPQTHYVVQLWRAVLDEIAPHVLLITETNVPHTDNISYFGNGTNEAQLVYNFALPPLVLHALLRARRQHPAFHPSGAQQVLSGDPSMFAVFRISLDRSERVLCLHNLANETLEISLPSEELGGERLWVNLISERVHRATYRGDLSFTLRPYDVLWLNAGCIGTTDRDQFFLCA
ncbi:MAG: hypothetical protein JNN07_23115 [Verrucomicrobiales bacterium]|nr:hypothetical protein [Verrucomicrobiales bacterium]